MPRTTATPKPEVKKPAATKPAVKPAVKPAAKKPAVAKAVTEKATRNIGEVEQVAKTTLGALPKGFTDILPESLTTLLDKALEDTKTINFGTGSLPNNLGYVRVYSQDTLATITDPEYLPHAYVRLESNKTLGSKVFYIHSTKLPGHPVLGEYTDALRDAYDVAISEALRDGGWGDFVPSAIATIGVVQELSPMLTSMCSMHDRPRRRLPRREQVYSTAEIGDAFNRNTLSILTRNGETDFVFMLDNLIEVNTQNTAVQNAIIVGQLLVTVTIGERNFTAAVSLDGYHQTLASLDQTLLLEYLNDAVRALLVTAWFDKLVGDVVVSPFVYTKTNVNL